MARIVNALIAALTAALTLGFFYRDGRWSLDNGKGAFRYFTVLSNDFCALAALLLCLFPAARWAWLFKYVGTAAVCVTMLTVFLFLGPSMGGYGELLKGRDFFLHLLTPLAALFSFVLLEKRGLRFGEALLGVIPVALYGLVYLYRVVYAPPEKRWEDFYGFNKGGKWPVAFTAMVTGACLVCLGLWALQNA